MSASPSIFSSRGHRYTAITAAMFKRTLHDCNVSAGERLDLLEKLNGLTDLHFTAAVLAAIEPASDAEIAIIAEASSLDGSAERAPHSFEMLTRPEVFALFVAANRGLAAICAQEESRDAEKAN